MALAASKSMYPHRDGKIQRLLERLMGFAMAMDTDSAFDLYLFGNDEVKLQPLTWATIGGYVQREIIGTHKINQSTVMHPPLRRFTMHFLAPKSRYW
ncbi:VWA domain-containing protein [Pseudomonas sp. S1(2024)]|uniref:VWA domain-containing protein n=1 Tax=Pseudomonas sp. S1(2024) TaxID=3390191 RepID=UPI003979E13F